jgi:hypothetical protein
MPKALEPASNARMKFIVKIFEERRQREQREHALGRTESDATEDARTTARATEGERFIHAMDATLVVGESGSQLSADLVLSNQYLYVVVHDSIRHVASLADVVDVKERTQDDHKLLSVTLSAAAPPRAQYDYADDPAPPQPATAAPAQASSLTFIIPKRSAKSAFIVQLTHQTRLAC